MWEKKWKCFLFLPKFTFPLLIKKYQDIWASRSAVYPGHWIFSATVEKSRGFQANRAILRSGKWGRWWFDSRHFKLLFWDLLASLLCSSVIDRYTSIVLYTFNMSLLWRHSFLEHGLEYLWFRKSKAKPRQPRSVALLSLGSFISGYLA